MSIRSRISAKAKRQVFKFVSARLPGDVFDNVKEEKRRDGLSWDELLTILCESYLDESKRARSEQTESGGEANAEAESESLKERVAERFLENVDVAIQERKRHKKFTKRD